MKVCSVGSRSNDEVMDVHGALENSKFAQVLSVTLRRKARTQERCPGLA